MSDSSKRTLLSRREALLLSATAGISLGVSRSAHASDSIKTGVHQEPGNVSTPRSAVAKTQYGKVRGFLDGGVFTFKGVPYGQTTAAENRWLLPMSKRILSQHARLRPPRLSRERLAPAPTHEQSVSYSSFSCYWLDQVTFRAPA